MRRCSELQLQCRRLPEKSSCFSFLEASRESITREGGGGAGEYGIEIASPYRRPAPWSNFGEKEKRLCAVLLEFLLAPSSLNFSLPTSFCHPPQNSLSLSHSRVFWLCETRSEGGEGCVRQCSKLAGFSVYLTSHLFSFSDKKNGNVCITT